MGNHKGIFNFGEIKRNLQKGIESFLKKLLQKIEITHLKPTKKRVRKEKRRKKYIRQQTPQNFVLLKKQNEKNKKK